MDTHVHTFVQQRTVYIIKIDLHNEDTLYIMGYSFIYNFGFLQCTILIKQLSTRLN